MSWVKIGDEETGDFGFINNNGKFVISPQYDNVSDFSEGFAAVMINGKYYYINKRGKTVFPQRKYEHIRLGTEITTNVIEQCFDGARFFSEDLAAVKTGKKWGYINKKGRFVINPQFDVADDFSGGLAKVRIRDKSGFINKSGKFIINPTLDIPINLFKDFFPLSKLYIGNRNNFSEGFSMVTITNGEAMKYGYIDRTGKISIKPQFDFAGNFSEELAVVEVNGKFGYIDKSGQFVINPTFDWAADFSGGLAQARVDEPSTIHLRKKSDKIVPLTEKELQILGIQRPKIKKYGYIEKTGKYIWEPTK